LFSKVIMEDQGMAEEADDVHWKMDAVMLVCSVFCLSVVVLIVWFVLLMGN